MKSRVTAAMQVALGKRAADLVVQGADVLNVYTGEVLPGWSVAVSGELISYLGPDQPGLVGPATRVLDGRGMVLVPGFIDAHSHLGHMVGIEQVLPYTLPRGTTTLVLETKYFAFVGGYQAVVDHLEHLAAQPANCFALAPQVLVEEVWGYTPPLTTSEIEQLAEHPLVIGLDETYWPVVLEQGPVLDWMLALNRRGKPVQGHSAGARGGKLNAFVAAGIASCHEPVTVDEALERLRLGIYVMMREGDVRADLANLIGLKDLDIDRRRLVLVTDNNWPLQCLAKGHMDYVVQRAIDLGWPPVAALQMATLNAAEALGLRGLGAIAPGMQADFLLLPALDRIQPRVVVCRGREVAREGQSLIPCKPVELTAGYWQLNLPRDYQPGDFQLPASQGQELRTIRVGAGMLTSEGRALMGSSRVNTVAVLDRGSGRVTLAPVEGFDLERGAIAISITWDYTNPVVVGADPEAMAVAANRLRALGGAFVVVDGEQVLAELPLPGGGIMSPASLPEIDQRVRQVEQGFAQLGSRLTRPLLALQTVTFSALPLLRLTPLGVVDILQKRVVGWKI